MDEKLKKLHNELSDLENNKTYILIKEKIRRKRMEIANFKYDCKHKFEIWREGMEIYEGDSEYYCLAICKYCGIQRNFDGEDVKNLDLHKDYKWEDVKID